MSCSKQTEWVDVSDHIDGDVIVREALEELLQRLTWITLKPKRILVASVNPSRDSDLLKKHFAEAEIVECDCSGAILPYAKHEVNPDDKQSSWTGSDALKLPFKDQTFDIVFANLLHPLIHQQDELLKEWRRILRANGLLAFSSLGPGTLQNYQKVLKASLLPLFTDMHDIGDALVKLRFSDPVLDVEHINLNYKTISQLLAELVESHMIKQPQNLTDLVAELPNQIEHPLTIPFEIIFALAFRPDLSHDQVADEYGTVKIPLSHLRRPY